jgi:DNA-directed RNA polymerase subunit omega
MLYPPLDGLLKQVGSKFIVVTLAMRRAHQLNNKAPRLIDNPRSTKPVGIALEEIYAGKIKAKRLKPDSLT